MGYWHTRIARAVAVFGLMAVEVTLCLLSEDHRVLSFIFLRHVCIVLDDGSLGILGAF